jgi:hypothetical protein
MMQQINLHQPVTRRAQGTLSAHGAAGALLAIALALVAMWGFASWQLHGMRSELLLAHTQLDAQVAMQAAQVARFEALSQEDLDRLIASLETEIAAKSRALLLVQSEKRKGASFSERLAALSRQHVEGVWLDRLTLGPGSDAMGLSGSALTPDLVPRYLKSLAADPALRGGVIDSFIIDRPADAKAQVPARLQFRAGTRALPAPAAAAES